MSSPSSSDLANIEAFIRDMRELGAARVRVGDVVVDFDLPLVEAPRPAEEEDPKKVAERLMYGSSD